METYIHTMIYKLRGSPAWKHTFTQEDRPTSYVGGPALTQ